MNNVPSLGKGIKDVVVNLEEKTITVTYDAQKNNDDKIIKGLKSLNVNAEPVPTTASCTMPSASPKQDCCASGDTIKACSLPASK